MRRRSQATAFKNIKALAPLLDRVLVQRLKAEPKTAGGIFLPETAVKELNEAKVLAVGPGALDKDGKRLPMGVKQGDKVLIPQVRPSSGRTYVDARRRGYADEGYSTVAAPSRSAKTNIPSSETTSKQHKVWGKG
jgi:chaperonin GroES